MKIVLVVTNSKRKNLVYISRELNTYSLEEAIQLTRTGTIEDAHIVQREKDAYIRTNRSVTKSNEFDNLSITASNLLLYTQDAHLTKATPALQIFIELYRNHFKKNKQLIKPTDQSPVLSVSVKEKLQQNQNIIFDAAKKFDINPYLIGAILVDEIARMLPFEAIIDILGVQIIGGNTSVGIAQVKTDTANSIIKLGLYNPNPKDPKLPFKQLNRTARIHLYTYLVESKHSIFFAAAIIRDILNSWQLVAGDKLTYAVIATLYSKGGKPHSNPIPNERGKQIAGEFYAITKEILK